MFYLQMDELSLLQMELYNIFPMFPGSKDNLLVFLFT